MKGCLTWIFRLLLGAFLLLLLVIGWAYRRELRGMWHFWRNGATTETPITGSASPRGLARATDLVDSLNGWRADSILLDAEELASLLQAGLGGSAARYLDSVTVTLGTDRAVVSASLATEAIPRQALGPLRHLVRDREHVQVGGELLVAGSESGQFRVEDVKLRGIPFPSAFIGRFMSSSLGAAADGTVTFKLPRGIRDLKVRPHGVILYGGGR